MLDIAEVRVQGAAQMTVSITGYQVDAVFGQWNLSGKPNATFPYMGILTPP